MSSVLAIDGADLLRRVLAEHLCPQTDEVFCFGSRAEGKARTSSDLDLLIRSRRSLSLEALALLKEALEESDLPYRVDVVDAARTSPSFLDRIASKLVPISF